MSLSEDHTSDDRIVELLREGRRGDALRLIGTEGVWMPFRDPGYFDSELIFPVFSSARLIPQFLRQRGLIDESMDQTIKAHQVGAEFFAACPHLEEILTLNPGTELEWTLSPAEFRVVATYAGEKG